MKTIAIKALVVVFVIFCFCYCSLQCLLAFHFDYFYWFQCRWVRWWQVVQVYYYYHSFPWEDQFWNIKKFTLRHFFHITPLIAAFEQIASFKVKLQTANYTTLFFFDSDRHLDTHLMVSEFTFLFYNWFFVCFSKFLTKKWPVVSDQ